jgi:hypothetical protein
LLLQAYDLAYVLSQHEKHNIGSILCCPLRQLQSYLCYN